jgi:hypothetical protein
MAQVAVAGVALQGAAVAVLLAVARRAAVAVAVWLQWEWGSGSSAVGSAECSSCSYCITRRGYQPAAPTAVPTEIKPLIKDMTAESIGSGIFASGSRLCLQTDCDLFGSGPTAVFPRS